MPWLEQQLALIAPTVVVTLGRHALAHFAPGRKITEVHGEPLLGRGFRIVPWFHPAAALRSRTLRDALFADARALPGQLAPPVRSSPRSARSPSAN
jgi:DNA polymerase